MATGTAAPPAVGPEDLATVALADQLEWCRDEMSRLSAENDLLRQLLLQATTFGPRTLAAPPPHPGSEPVGACAACVGSPLPQIGGQESPLPQVQRRRARNGDAARARTHARARTRKHAHARASTHAHPRACTGVVSGVLDSVSERIKHFRLPCSDMG